MLIKTAIALFAFYLGIVTHQVVADTKTQPKPTVITDIRTCLKEQVDMYGDLCAESSSGYETMSGKDAHYAGVKCAVESINTCLDLIEIQQ